jgi:hypothetical protein
MKNIKFSNPVFLVVVLVATSTVSLTSCGEGDTERARYDASTRGDSIHNADGTYTYTDGTVRRVDGTYTYSDGSVRHADGTVLLVDADGTVRNAEGTVYRDGQAYTPAEDRNATLGDLQRMRARLITELEAVRARLNQGTLTPDEQAAQTSRAGELAQGLERLDRAILEVDQTNEGTWPAIRSNSRRGAEDFRVWMRKNNMEG